MSTQLMLVLLCAFVCITFVLVEIIDYAKETAEPKKTYCPRCKELNDHDH